ncbi:hypothetical protein CathTA2_2580 [Caldalkalibacillus thermarum TA2.A1]|uniref:YlzJ-like family protein n=1 Tax=Caldalkalibacillus thermarum (strain TA2.A1) TaxID=986075 RepID=F5L9S5_CALTT|nr:YlzJ-like family protein [Caldalkalibacillus thermarum]EGL81924.1 hypothetical protein CathTA2_2580 [Caldalkalibacillus thermarum TA2.A1]QZT32967.1 YlzJ-like family protein [Caldalkalibacillus thermarum TA2.A1]
MIIYTSMPLELVYEGYEQFQPRYEEIDYNGVKMVIEPSGPFKAKIVRLISADPQDYLNPNYSPGSMLYFRASK